MDKDLQNIINIMQTYCDIGKDLLTLNPIDFYDRVVKPIEDHSEYMPEYNMGATKGVMIFSEQDLVIKIPFGANEYDEDEYAYALERWDRGDIEEEPMIEDYLMFFGQAENFFIETQHNWDYCELECGIYQEAVKEGLEAYFAKEEWVADVNGYPVYVQVLVSPFNDDRSSHSRSDKDVDRVHDSCKKMGVRCFNSEWIADFFDIYGEDEFKRLSKFLEKLCICDLHAGNVGYLGKYPILLDYSNYNE
jgi:hypothetical protein